VVEGARGCWSWAYVGAVDRPRVQRRLVEVGRLPGVRLVAVRAVAGAESLRAKVPGAKVLGDVSGIDLAHAVASYDVLVQPRRKELDCHGVRRALASGVPVVGFATGGVPDLVTHGVNGILVDPRQPHGMRDAVASLVGDPGLVSRLAGPARASASGRTWTDAVDELLTVCWAGALRELARSG
jgi:phosphatidylinositol alpha 1,6-mannosyltransferase